MNVNNELPEDTSLHWHGMHLPAEMDGGPHQMVAVGESWLAHLGRSSNRPAPSGITPTRTAKPPNRSTGASPGLILIETMSPTRSGLPSDYGVDDIPLIIQDRDFHDDGRLSLSDHVVHR
jgi:FtsP/CotA-like multicopper oxidase with cupredoxin domain